MSLPGGVLVALFLTSSPPSLLTAQSPDRPHSDLEGGTDPRITPGDDFFAFANGAWLRSTVIPPGTERVTARTEIGDTTRQRLARLMEALSAAPAGSLARKVADFRAAYRSDEAIEAAGMAPIRFLLDSVEQLRDKAGLIRFLGRSMRADVDPLNRGIYQSASLLGLSVEPSIHGEKTNVAFLLQGGLGLPDRENYLSADAAMVALRDRYQRYLSHILAGAGCDQANARASKVLALETAIARTHATRAASANDHNADSVWSRADFRRRAPGMDWSLYLGAAGLGNEAAVVVWQPSAVTGVAALVESEPLAAWQDYLRTRVIDRFAEVLPRAMAEAAFTLRAAVGGAPQPSTRDQRALEVTQSVMGDAIGRLYVERYFAGDQKARIEAILAKVSAALQQRVEQVPWMSPPSKAIALAKLRALYVGIGYPRQSEDGEIEVSAVDPVQNLQRVDDRDYRRALSRLGRPVDRMQWWMTPQTVGAILIFQQNAYNFPAALLQATKFDPAASEAANYGAIGAILGHEISHTVDLLGAEWDAENRLRPWWTVADSAGYQSAADRLNAQVAAYQPLPGLRINAKVTQTENVADLTGLAVAFEAYRATLGPKAADPAYVRQQDREFFIGFARSWRSRVSEAALRTQLATDNHAPEAYRIALVRNLDAWYDAFEVRPGQRLYLEPSDRVRVW
jgi:predicted metalloendopeptidase